MQKNYISYLTCWLCILLAITSNLQAESRVFMANGIKIGEVDQTSAIIWTRLTKYAERNINGKPFNPKQKREDQKFENLDKMEAAVPGIAGEIQIKYWENKYPQDIQKVSWVKVSRSTDYIHQFRLKNLKAGTKYHLKVEGRSDGQSSIFRHSGSFTTAPSAKTKKEIMFAVTTCGDYPRRDDGDAGHKIYKHMKNLTLDFFIHAGDIEYYDKPAPWADSLELARFKWRRIFALENQREFHRVTPSYFMKDDHDLLKNDCWPGQTYGNLTFEQGLSIFKEQVPMGKKTYRTIRWGKDLQIWMVEGRDYRSPNTDFDGPNKTIWGEEQKAWVFNGMKNSDATFKLLISPTPILGPDRSRKNDNHANKGFTFEGNQIRNFIGQYDNMYIVCGDRHWQYASIDHKTGAREFACGSASDAHAGGFKESMRNDMHRYLKIIGGFLSVKVHRENNVPKISFRHHDVNGEIQNEDIWPKN